MAGVRIRFNGSGMRGILHDPQLEGLLQSEVQRVAAAATSQVGRHTDDAYGPPFTAGVDDRGSRFVGYVVTSNYDGMHAEATSRALSKAL